MTQRPAVPKHARVLSIEFRARRKATSSLPDLRRCRAWRRHLYAYSAGKPDLRCLSLWDFLGYGCLQLLRRMAGKPLQRLRAGEGGRAGIRKDLSGLPYAGRNTDHFATLASGGQTRDPQTIFSHRMPGASDETLLQNTVTLTATARRDGEKLIVDVTILNDQAGHHVPTDSPLRQMILLVSAADQQGQPLTFQDGPTVPEWGGVGDPSGGYYAGLPGKGFAKILSELWTEISPSGAYWNQTRLLSDNRIPALGTDTSTYIFAARSRVKRRSKSACFSAVLSKSLWIKKVGTHRISKWRSRLFP